MGIYIAQLAGIRLDARDCWLDCCTVVVPATVPDCFKELFDRRRRIRWGGVVDLCRSREKEALR